MPYPSKLSRPLITDVALTLVEAGGATALTLRAVAERLAVRPSSLYKHVGDAAGLQALVAEAAAARLQARLEAAVCGVPDGRGRSGTQSVGTGPAVRLRLAAQAYRTFARAHPGLYAVLITDTSGSALGATQPGTARKALWNALLALVAPLTGNDDDTGAAVAVWAFLHGFASLEDAGMFGASGPQDGFERGVDALAAGLPRRTAP
jgi:AcrR family transcriptional regulator